MALYLRLLGAGLAGYALLAFLGWLPWRLLLARRDVLPFVVGAPSFGFAVLSAFGWYWLEYGTGGLDTGLRWLIGGVAVVSAMALLLQRAHARAWLPEPSWLLSAAVVAVLAFAGLAVHYRTPLGDDRLTAASLGNNDIAAYALVSQDLRSSGFDDHGPVVGSNLGHLARVDATGADVLLTADAEITGLGTHEATIPVIGLGALLVALACALLTERIVPGSPLRAVIIGLAAIAPYMFVLNAGHYFLSQILSIGPVLAMLVVYLWVAEQRDRASLLRGIVVVALLMVPLVLTYPHMAILSQPVAFAIAWLASGFRDLLRRAARLVVCAAAGLAGAALLVAPVVGDAVDRARHLSNVEAGWPLGLLSPFQALGLQRAPSMDFRPQVTTPSPSLFVYGAELAVVVGLAAVATLILVRARKTHAWLGGLTVVAVLVSYRIAYFQQGFSYRQWKWLSFFQPMLAAAFAALLCAAAVALLARSAIPTLLLRGVGWVAIAVWIGVLTANARTVTDTQWLVVGRDLAALRAVPKHGLRTVNAEVAPDWESMWAAYFIAPTRTRIVAPTQYYARSAPLARWTVRRIEPTAPADDRAASSSIRIDKVFELTCDRPPCPIPRR